MKLSIGMMVKNEAKNLERCLQSLQPLRNGVDSELIVVDTGSEDNTVEIARKYTDKVYFHPWNNDFSAMRNVTISYAKGEWFLVIDADEVLENPQAVIEFLKSKESDKFNAVVLFVNNYMKSNDSKFSTMLSHRLFRRNENFYYTGAVHNQPVYEEPITDLPARIHHYGYVGDDLELMERKFIRTSTILKSELEKEPEHIYYLYQLAITYGMHSDFAEAIEYIEKAYQVFLKVNKPKNCMFVLTSRAMLYQMVRDFKKVEEVCLDALEVSDGYIDIHYYLAEAQAVLGKHQEAVHTYGRYLKMLHGYYEAEAKDIGVIDYTLCNEETAYFNLSNLLKHANDFEQALQYAEKITNTKSIQENLATIIYLYIKLEKYDALKQYFDRFIEKEGRSIFYQYLEETTRQFNEATRNAVAKAFCEMDDDYGLLCTIFLAGQNGIYSEKTIGKIKQIDFLKLPVYCSGILYYLMQRKYPLHTILITFKEVWIDSLFEDIVRQYPDLSVKIYEYLQHYHDREGINDYKLSKTLCRYLLLLNKLEDSEQQTVFARYVKDCISYMQLIYNPCVLAEELVYEVKNDEEVFMLYMHQARSKEKVDQVGYVKYLSKALQSFPQMKRGVEYLLQQFEKNQAGQANSDITTRRDEFESYKLQVKATIYQLIAADKVSEAKAILEEYKGIVPDDLEVVLLESKILLK